MTIDNTNIQNRDNFMPWLKTVVEDGITNLAHANRFLTDLYSREGITGIQKPGKEVQIDVQFGINQSFAPVKEGGRWPVEDKTRVGKGTLKIKQVMSAGGITDLADYTSKEKIQASWPGLKLELKSLAQGHAFGENRQALLRANGLITDITDVEVDPGSLVGWRLTLGETRPLEAGWIRKGLRLHLGSYNAGTDVAALEDSGAILLVVAVDRKENTIDVKQVEGTGTSTPATGEWIAGVDAINESINGLGDILYAYDKPFMGINPAEEPDWAPVYLDVDGAAPDINALQEVHNEVTYASGNPEGKGPNVIATDHPIARALHDDLVETTHISNPVNDPAFGHGVKLPFPGEPRLKESIQLPKGKINLLSTKNIVEIGEKKGRLADTNNDGVFFHRWQAESRYSFYYTQFKEYGTNQRNAHGVIDNVASSGGF